MAATLVLFINIVLRAGFSANTTWAEEFIRYCMIWITFIGSALCFRRGLHVGIDLFVEFLSKPGQKIVRLLVYVCSLVMLVFMAKYGYDLVQFSQRTGQITPSLRIEMFWVYLAIPIGAILSIIHVIERMVGLLRGHEPTSEAGEESV
ncbi:TRAP transporter small permease [Bacillaceae bacterium SIJ1]|nr:TRAP transporter small permease [Litoribacterium kuwaitense]